jgi:hypothetical protein
MAVALAKLLRAAVESGDWVSPAAAARGLVS